MNKIKNWYARHEEAIKTGQFVVGMAGVSAILLKIEWHKIDKDFANGLYREE
jgi:hypothetical protein